VLELMHDAAGDAFLPWGFACHWMISPGFDLPREDESLPPAALRDLDLDPRGMEGFETPAGIPRLQQA
jgi:hypothetical protein